MKLDKGLAKGIVKISFVVLLLLVFGFFVFNFVLPAFAEGSGATIWTTDAAGNSKSDFSFGDVVYIHGSGFNPTSQINIVITRPDLAATESCDAVSCNSRFLNGLQTSDDEGNFVYQYQLNGIEGTYTVDVSDGINSAQTSFTDSRTIISATLDGGGSVTAPPSTSITAAVTVRTTSGSDWESTRYRIEGGSWTCVDTPDHIYDSGTHTDTESFTITAPSSLGTYDVTFVAYLNDDCSGSGPSTLTLTDGIIVANAYSGPNSPSTSADDSTVGTKSWTTPSNVQTQNDVYATAHLDASEVTHYLKATGFGFSIPAGATIDGIKVEVDRYESGSSVRVTDNSVRLVKNKVISGDEKSTGADWPNSDTDTYIPYGGSTDKWGLTWTYSDINSANFGVVISAKKDSNSHDRDAYIDHIRMTVYYTPDTTPPTTIDNVPSAWQTSATTITLTCDDGSGSGCSKVYYTTDGSTPTTGSSYVDAGSSWQFTVSSAGTYTIKYFGVDNVGNTESVKTAANTLKIAICGNGNKEGPEVCDSNSQSCTIGGYAGTQSCNAQCDGWNTCVATESCGDRIVNNGEACDEGGLNGQPNHCNAQCSGTTTPVCSNGVIEAGETCDDTNTNNGDGCSNVCAVESGYTCSGEPSVCSLIARYVATTGIDTGNCINPSSPCKTITYAIGQASDGETVHVAAGTYNEQLTINKNNLVIQSTDGAATTIINLGQPSETTGIWILGNGITFSGFTVQGISPTPSHAQYAIRVRGSDNHILNNIIIGNPSRDWWSAEEDSGINLDGTSTTETANNIIENNEIYDFSAMGVQVVGSGGNYNAHDNIIRNNNIHDIQWYAIVIDRSASQTVHGNILTDIGPAGHAGDGYYSTGVVVWGAQSSGTVIDDQDVSGIENGIVLSATQGVTIQNSEISSNGVGIKLSDSSWLQGSADNNVIQYNEVHDNDDGIVVKDGDIGANNLINNNKIYSNTAGPTGLHNYDEQVINAENNWWGSSSGPYHATLNPTGKGDTVSDNVDFDPWTTENGVGSVQQGEEYVLSPGVNITFTSTTEAGSVTFSDSECSSSPTIFNIAGRCYEITSTMSDGSFTAQITFYYDDANDDGIVDGTGINENYLTVYYNDGAGWVSVPESDVLERNTVANYIKIEVTHLTGFSLSPFMDVTGYEITPDWAKGSQTNIGILDLEFTNTGALGDTITQVKVTFAGTTPTSYVNDVAWVKLWEDNGDGVFDPGTDTQRGGSQSFDFIGVATFNINVAVGAGTTKHLFVSYDTGASAGNGNFIDAYIAAGDITMTNSGTNVGALDPAGSATLDTVAPTVGITTAPGIYKGTIDLGATATDGGSGMQKVEFYKGVPGVGTYLGEGATPPYSYSWSTTPADDGTYTIWVRGYDNVGNYQDIDTVTITIDNTKPTTTLNPIATPTAINTFSITGTSTDATTNIFNVQWKYSTEAWTAGKATVPDDGAFNEMSEDFHFDVGPLADGAYTVNVRATDSANNVEDPISATFCVDTTPPSAPGTPTHSDATANPGYDDDLSLYFSWTAATDTPACSGVDHYVIYKSVNGGAYVYEGTSPTNSYTLTGSDGNSYKTKVEAVDKANNVGPSAESSTILIDTTLPVISNIVFTPTDQSNVNTPYITFDVTDSSTGTASGVDTSTIQVSDGTNIYRTSTSPAIVCTGPVSGTYSCSITWSTLADGDYTFTFDGKDLAGNSATQQTVAAYTIDTFKPTTWDDAPSGWQTSTFTVTLTESDPIPSSGIEWTKYCVDATNTCIPDTIGTSIPFSTNGQYYLRYHSKDNAGNVQDVVNRFVQLDTVKPTTTDDTDPLTPWYATDRTVTLACSDATSKCDKTYYCIYNSGEAACTPTTEGTSVSVTCGADSVCQKIVRYYSVDKATNAETAHDSNVIKIDKQKPTGYSVSVDGVATIEYMAGTVTVRCNGATDGSGSGVNANSYDFEYSLDGSSWFAMFGCTGTTSSCSWDASAITDDASSLRCRVGDNVANVGDWAKTDYAGIDNTKPTSAITYPSDGEWLSKLVEGTPVTITGTAADANSGVQKVEISTSDVGGWNLATGTTSWSYSWGLPTDGNYTISSRATDNAKPSPNVESTYTITVHVDSTPPTVSITLPASLPDATAGWYKDTISISHTETDNMALNYCEYKYNGGSWSAIPCNTPLSFDTNVCSDGSNTCTVDMKVWDMAGNSATDSKTFSVDNSAPTISSVLLSDNTVKEGTTITITSDGTDPQTLQSCVAFTYDSLSNLIPGSEQALGFVAPNECDGSYTLPTGIPDGNYQIRVRARNHAGTDSWLTADIIVDDTPPVITNTAVSDSIVQSGVVVNINTRITDNLAGVDPSTTKAHVQNPDGNDIAVVNLLDDGTGCDSIAGDGNFCAQWTSAGVEGTYYVDIRADDNAGNSQWQDNGATIIVDNTPPIMYYAFPGKNWVGLGQTFYVDALASDNVGFDTPTYCVVGIDDFTGFRPIGSILYNPATWKCSGYVTVSDTFNEGSVGLFVIIQDAAGNSAQQPVLIGIDNTPPFIATITTTPTATSFIKTGQTISFDIGFQTDMSGLTDSTCYISLNNTGGQSWPIQSNRCYGNYVVPSGLSDGEVLFMLKIKDNAGNWLEDDINFRLDNSAPIKTMISPVYNGSYSTYIPFVLDITDYAGVNDSTATFRISNDWNCLQAKPFNLFDPATWICAGKFDSLWIVLDNSTRPTYWYNYSTDGMAEGTYYFGTKVCDILGTCGDPSGSIIIDKTPPTWPSGASLTVTSSPYDKDGDVTLSWSAASDALSGVDHYNIYLNGTLNATRNSTTYSYPYINLSDGLYNFNVTSVDAAGNENSGLTGSTTVQRSCSVDVTCTPPTPTTTGGGGVVGGGGFIAVTTTIPTTTTVPPTGQTTTTTVPTTTTSTTTTVPTAPSPLTITGLLSLISGNTTYQVLIALTVIALLLAIFRYKWVSAAKRKGSAPFSWIFGNSKNQKKTLRKSKKRV